MDRIRKSVRQLQMTLFIVIRRVSSVALTCFDRFLAGFGVNYEFTENHFLPHNNNKPRKAVRSSEGILL